MVAKVGYTKNNLNSGKNWPKNRELPQFTGSTYIYQVSNCPNQSTTVSYDIAWNSAYDPG